VAFVGAVDCEFSQNTVIDPRLWILRILQETSSSPPYTFAPCSNNTVANNLFYFNRSRLRTHLNIGANTLPDSFTFGSNLWYAHDNPAASAPALPSKEVGGVIGVNPQLVNPEAGDYSICAAGPAAERGVPPARAPADFRGVCFRPAPPIGAYDGPAAPRADFNDDAQVISQDLFDFLQAFFAVEPDADFNTDGAVNSQDFFDYVDIVFSGC
jgi:hypothetical protein